MLTSDLCQQYMETVSSRQMDMQKFIADGCKEALLEEKRRFCFLADKHCMFSYQISNFHEKVRLDGELILGSLDLVPFLALFNRCSAFPRPGRCSLWSSQAGRKSAAISLKYQPQWWTWLKGCLSLQSNRQPSDTATGWVLPGQVQFSRSQFPFR